MSTKVSASALLLATLIGCAPGRAPTPTGGVSPAQAPLTIAAVAGEYALVMVDGRALPYAPIVRGNKDGATARAVTSGSFSLNTSGTFRLQTVYEPAGEIPNSAAGACYTEGNEVKMAWDDGGTTNITVRGDTVALKREGAMYTYLRKR
jgi:hypothetical protein